MGADYESQRVRRCIVKGMRDVWVILLDTDFVEQSILHFYILSRCLMKCCCTKTAHFQFMNMNVHLGEKEADQKAIFSIRHVRDAVEMKKDKKHCEQKQVITHAEHRSQGLDSF